MTRAVVCLLAILLTVLPAGMALGSAPGSQGSRSLPPFQRKSKRWLSSSTWLRSRQIQAEAAGKLAAMGEGAAPATKYLVNILNEKIDPTVRQAVVATLIKLGRPVLEPVRAALKAQREETRLNAIEILETLVDKEAAGPLTDATLHDSTQAVRDRALGALARLAMADPAVAQKLMTTVEDDKEKPEIRSRAMKALGRMSGVEPAPGFPRHHA